LFDSNSAQVNFKNDFMHLANPDLENAWKRVRLNDVWHAGFLGLLLVRTDPNVETRFPLDVIPTFWKYEIDALLGGDATTDGRAPVMTWLAFPKGIAGLASDGVYLQIVQEITVRIDGWFDYQASFGYHIAFRLDGAGNPEARVLCPPIVHVASGVAQARIQADLLKRAAAASSIVESKINGLIGVLGTGFKSVYLLPGSHAPPVQDVYVDSTFSNVTLVLERSV
jgi:hypothetical protein